MDGFRHHSWGNKIILEADKADTSVELILTIDWYEDYTEHLKSYRKRGKMKQAELTGLLGVNLYTLRSWEKKKAKRPTTYGGYSLPIVAGRL